MAKQCPDCGAMVEMTWPNGDQYWYECRCGWELFVDMNDRDDWVDVEEVLE